MQQHNPNSRPAYFDFGNPDARFFVGGKHFKRRDYQRRTAVVARPKPYREMSLKHPAFRCLPPERGFYTRYQVLRSSGFTMSAFTFGFANYE